MSPNIHEQVYLASQERLQALQRDPAAGALADVNAVLERGAPDSAVALELLQRLESVPSSRLAQEAQQPTPLGQWCALALHLRQTLLQYGAQCYPTLLHLLVEELVGYSLILLV